MQPGADGDCRTISLPGPKRSSAVSRIAAFPLVAADANTPAVKASAAMPVHIDFIICLTFFRPAADKIVITDRNFEWQNCARDNTTP